MLGSISPLGERARGRSWTATVSTYVIGSALGGATIGGALGAAGAGGARALGRDGGLAVLAVVAVIGVALDARVWGLHLPTVLRQVNQDWTVRYRGWVVGLGFGAQLGLGVVTIVTTSAVYAALAAAALSGRATAGAAVGASFGLVRGATLLAGATVTRPDRLARVDQVLGRWDAATRAGAMATQSALAVAVAVGALR